MQLLKEVIPIQIIVRPTITPVKDPKNRDQKVTNSIDSESASVLISNANPSVSSIESTTEGLTEDSATDVNALPLQLINVKYPQLSRLNHEEGTTYIVFKGNNAVMVVSSGYSRLDAEAMSAVQQLLLKQKVREGQKYKVQFKLD